MYKNKTSPPQIAKKIMENILPKKNKEYIIGDLEEEYYIISKNGDGKANLWFWGQTVFLCITSRIIIYRFVALLFSLSAIILFLMLYFSMTFISYFDGIDIYTKSFWVNGSVHDLYFETDFWNFLKTFDFTFVPIWHLFDIKAIVWSTLIFWGIHTLDKYNNYNVLILIIISLIGIFTPYVLGVIYFLSMNVEIKNAGSVITMMWLPIFYMILPISYKIIMKITNKI